MKRYMACIGTLAVALGCATPPPAPKDPRAVAPLTLSEDERRIIDRLIIISDASGSMSSAGTFPEVKAITQDLVSALPDADVRGRTAGPYQAGFIGFGGDERIVSPLAEFERSALVSAAARLKLLGGPRPLTPLDGVIDEAREAFSRQPGGAALIIISDGKPQVPGATLAAAQNLIASVPAGVCIHTVHTGSDADGRDLLARLARLTACGSVREGASLNGPGAYTAFTHQIFVGAALSRPPP